MFVGDVTLPSAVILMKDVVDADGIFATVVEHVTHLVLDAQIIKAIQQLQPIVPPLLKEKIILGYGY